MFQFRSKDRDYLSNNSSSDHQFDYDDKTSQFFIAMRQASGLTQLEVANRLGTHIQLIHLLETGAIAHFTDWDELERVVRSYGAMLDVDIMPILKRVHNLLTTHFNYRLPPLRSEQKMAEPIPAYRIQHDETINTVQPQAGQYQVEEQPAVPTPPLTAPHMATPPLATNEQQYNSELNPELKPAMNALYEGPIQTSQTYQTMVQQLQAQEPGRNPVSTPRPTHQMNAPIQPYPLEQQPFEAFDEAITQQEPYAREFASNTQAARQEHISPTPIPQAPFYPERTQPEANAAPSVKLGTLSQTSFVKPSSPVQNQELFEPIQARSIQQPPLSSQRTLSKQFNTRAAPQTTYGSAGSESSNHSDASSNLAAGRSIAFRENKKQVAQSLADDLSYHLERAQTNFDDMNETINISKQSTGSHMGHAFRNSHISKTDPTNQNLPLKRRQWPFGLAGIFVGLLLVSSFALYYTEHMPQRGAKVLEAIRSTFHSPKKPKAMLPKKSHTVDQSAGKETLKQPDIKIDKNGAIIFSNADLSR